jgi:hypothetical protein
MSGTNTSPATNPASARHFRARASGYQTWSPEVIASALNRQQQLDRIEFEGPDQLR